MRHKHTGSTIRTRARAVIVVAAVTALVAGCGSSGSPSGGDSGTPTPTTAERSSRPVIETYDEDDTRIEVAGGDRFALKVVDRSSTGYTWIIDAPAPDSQVVEADGERRESADSGAVGSFGTRYFDFRAKSPGSTEITIRQCYRCGTEYEKVDADHEATTLTFHVTVRD